MTQAMIDMVVVSMFRRMVASFTTYKLNDFTSAWVSFSRGEFITSSHREITNTYLLRKAYFDQTGF